MRLLNVLLEDHPVELANLTKTTHALCFSVTHTRKLTTRYTISALYAKIATFGCQLTELKACGRLIERQRKAKAQYTRYACHDFFS